MKIGIDCRLWNETGVGRYIRNLVQNLLIINTSNEFVLFVLKEQRERIKETLRLRDVPDGTSLRSGSNVEIIESNIRWHSVAEQRKFPEIIENQHLDLMHFTYFSVPIRYSGKFVVTMHDMIPFSFATGKASTLPLPFYHAKRIAYKYIVREALKKAEKVIVPTNAVRDEILQKVSIPKDKVVVTYEGTSDLSQSSDSERSFTTFGLTKNRYFIYVGNAYPHKNLENLIEGFTRFYPQNPTYKLVLAGKKDYFYEQLMKSKTVQAFSDAVIHIENPTDSELKELYKNTSAFVSASRMEGFALTAFEAMSCGAPIILSDIPVFREIARNIPLVYFDPENTLEIRKAFEEVTNVDTKIKNESISLGKKLSQTFSWKKMAEETLKIYQEAAPEISNS